MAETSTPPLSLVADATANVVNPPPITAFREDNSSNQTNLTFTLKISEKLNEKNIHTWRQQVEPFINAHNLDDFLVSPVIPPRFLTADDHVTATLNLEYRKWRQKDQMLMSWIQTTLSSEILARVLGSTHTFELWNKILSYFQKQMRAKARQLLPLNHHLDIIFEGLPSDFNSVISVIESNFDSMDMDEAEALLLAHETRLEKSKKKTLDEICFKTGHPASECWHKSNLQYQPQIHPNYHAGYGQNPPSYGFMHYPAYNGYDNGFGASSSSFNPYLPRLPSPMRPSTSQVAPPNALIANAPSVSGSGTWYPDSGASYHVTADARNIQEPSFFDGADQVYIGNGQGLPIHSTGSSVFPSPLYPNISLSLNNLLHVP
ncbi:retrovirus-related Pol polyprotein from transposon TNT 1-94, partial [Trifolium pratense]